MSPDTRHETVLIPGTLPHQGRLKGVVRHFFGLVIVGVLIGLACLPLNLVDRVQRPALRLLPTTARGVGLARTAHRADASGGDAGFAASAAWSLASRSRLGIPSTMNALEDPSRLPKAMAAAGTVQRGVLWSIATVAMFPLGREGPVVQFGAAVAEPVIDALGPGCLPSASVKWWPSVEARDSPVDSTHRCWVPFSCWRN